MKRLWPYLMGFLLLTSPGFSTVFLDEMLTEEQMEDMGLDSLTEDQLDMLQDWLNDTFILQEDCECEEVNDLVVSMNMEQGAKLLLSDGSAYEIHPDDRVYSIYWIIPFPIELSASNDPDYPIKLTNLTSKTSVRANPISMDNLLKEDKEKARSQPLSPYSAPPPDSKPAPAPQLMPPPPLNPSNPKGNPYEKP